MTIARDKTGAVIGQVIRPVPHPINIRPQELVILTARGIETVRVVDVRLEEVSDN
jgi:hypothetical protein